MTEEKRKLTDSVALTDDEIDYRRLSLPSSRKEQFLDIYKNNFFRLVLVNALMFLFFIPVLLIYVYENSTLSYIGNTFPFSANAGVGFPGFIGVQDVANIDISAMYFIVSLCFIPAILFATPAVAGGLYVAKRLMYGEALNIRTDFFKGIKVNFKQTFWAMLLLSLIVFFMTYNLKLFPSVSAMPAFMNVVVKVGSIIILILTGMVMMYVLTQINIYHLKFHQILKNSIIFTLAVLPKNILVILLCASFFILMMIFPSLLPILIALFLPFGFFFVTLVCTLYTQSVYDKFVNDKVDQQIKNKGIYSKEEMKKEQERRRKKASYAVKYANPKKKRPAATSNTITPLEETFRREDLEKLQQEKSEEFAMQDAESAENTSVENAADFSSDPDAVNTEDIATKNESDEN